MRSGTITRVYFIKHGETPWQFSHAPGELTGPYGRTVRGALRILRHDGTLRDTHVERTWLRGDRYDPMKQEIWIEAETDEEREDRLALENGDDT